jgi:hypothetical protein
MSIEIFLSSRQVLAEWLFVSVDVTEYAAKVDLDVASPHHRQIDVMVVWKNEAVD